jgi:Tfp pilus assembly protein PilN
MKFQINIYKPGKRTKAIKGMKGIPRERRPTRLPFFLFLGAIVLVVMAFVYLYSTQIRTMDRRIRADRKQILMVREFMNQAKEGQNQKSDVGSVLVELQEQRVLWKDKLVELSRLVPDEIRLTQLTMETVEKRPDRKNPRLKVEETVLTIKGEIVPKERQESLDHVAHLIKDLNESPTFKRDFEPFTLVYTQQVITREREYVEFKLTGRLHDVRQKG